MACCLVFEGSWVILFIITTTTTTTTLTEAASNIPCQRIGAAVRWPGQDVTYFFSGDEYMTYDDGRGAEKDVSPLSSLRRNFPGIPTKIDAAVTWFGEREIVFFSGCSHTRVNVNMNGRRRKKRAANSALGLPCNVSAAVNVGGDTIMFFQGCVYWTMTSSDPQPVEGGSTSSLGLPCNIDAALTWALTGTAYVIYKDYKTALSLSGQPSAWSLLDNWNLCSWKICPYRAQSHRLGDTFPCNGDHRFCWLRYDQLTMLGSHNAGSGFDGGFGFSSCWIRNHGQTVLGQLMSGVRFLDVDTDWNTCGLLGTVHRACGGSVCKMIKQIKKFLIENPREVVGINFNHEMRDVNRVLPALIRQLTSQLGGYVNSQYRDEGTWPLLGDSIRANKRLFIFVDQRVETVTSSEYLKHHWIHSESLLKSTWRGDVSVNNDCQDVVDSSQAQCQSQAQVPLLEMSVFGSSFSCVTNIADRCLPRMAEISMTCQSPRHTAGKAPNILLVDFPERGASLSPPIDPSWTVFLQNVRNVYALSGMNCSFGVGAAISWINPDGKVDGKVVVMYGVGGGPIIYDWETRFQRKMADTRRLPLSVDAAFQRTNDNCFVSGCKVTCLRGQTPWGDLTQAVFPITSGGVPCHLDSALYLPNTQSTYFFKGCHYWVKEGEGPYVRGPGHVTDMKIPCDVTATLRTPDGDILIFKGDQYWRHLGCDIGLSDPESLSEWWADLMVC